MPPLNLQRVLPPSPAPVGSPQRRSGRATPYTSTSGRERIQVFYRARGGSENTTSLTDHWTVHHDGKCITDGKKTFAAEATFGGEVPTSGVYATAVKGIVHSVTEGYNGSIMAYGQT
eukprot:CAMPEP_0198228320 /NCGR_PEP_ID=MMETSP1445-20131203/112757_1 /TAXON_ID=36898 /ORGANISM="Pyramimonas sp., Strain CCMP2087" /LENGTH=116 /DNA_ID=CAMNT_0043908643 /DNA_START=171 /DNA_END=517 /DNA_ORIENTATION=-